MEYITIKNFGPIANIENLAIQDMMVFIGPQATGKSTLAKLLWFFRNQLVNEVESLEISFLNLFPKTLLHPNTFLSFNYENGAEIVIEGTEPRISWKNKDSFTKNENQMSDYIPASRSGIGGIYNTIKSFLVGSLNGLAISGKIADYLDNFTILYFQKLEFDKSMFIRGFSPSATAFNMNVFVQNLFNFNPKQAKVFNKLTHKILNGGIIYVDTEGKEFIKENNRLIPLHIASTGQQETYGLLIRILSILSLQNVNLLNTNGVQIPNPTHNLLYVEEPESHLFPLAQKAVVELLMLFFNNKDGNQLVITTHSPYILTSINNLLFAHKVATQNPETHKEISALVDENKWLDNKKIGVYFVNEGTVRSIIDEETGLIGDQALDEASEVIGEEFDKILDIRRQSKKQKA